MLRLTSPLRLPSSSLASGPPPPVRRQLPCHFPAISASIDAPRPASSFLLSIPPPCLASALSVSPATLPRPAPCPPIICHLPRNAAASPPLPLLQCHSPVYILLLFDHELPFPKIMIFDRGLQFWINCSSSGYSLELKLCIQQCTQKIKREQHKN